jgi:hypothetical protein
MNAITRIAVERAQAALMALATCLVMDDEARSLLPAEADAEDLRYLERALGRPATLTEQLAFRAGFRRAMAGPWSLHLGVDLVWASDLSALEACVEWERARQLVSGHVIVSELRERGEAAAVAGDAAACDLAAEAPARAGERFRRL